MLRCAVTATCIVVACGAAGCATLQGDKHTAACTAGNWDRFGENDGRLGIATQERVELFEDCEQSGQPVDLSAYQVGRSRGLSVYCTVENGYEVGRTGRQYDGVCPTTVAADFLQGYEQGRREYDRGTDRYAGVSPNVTVGVGVGIGSRGRVLSGIGIGIGLGHYGPYGSHHHGHW